MRPCRELVAEGKQADLIVGNNVLAQVPDLNDFVAGMKLLLKPEGVITLEFPHLERLMAENQFDTIYHEHFSYFSLITIETLAAPRPHGHRRRGAVDPRRLAACLSRRMTKGPPDGPSVASLLAREKRRGFDKIEDNTCFAEGVRRPSATCWRS